MMLAESDIFVRFSAFWDLKSMAFSTAEKSNTACAYDRSGVRFRPKPHREFAKSTRFDRF